MSLLEESVQGGREGAREGLKGAAGQGKKEEDKGEEERIAGRICQ